MYSGTWKDFFADVALSLPISLDRIWHFLGPRFNPRESNKRLSESVAARQRVYFHRDLQVILRRKEVFPNTVSDRAASILIQSAATRFEADEDTAMNAGDTEDDNASVMNRIVCSALEDLNQQRAGRSNGSAWLALLREIETYMLHGRHQKSSPVSLYQGCNRTESSLCGKAGFQSSIACFTDGPRCFRLTALQSHPSQFGIRVITKYGGRRTNIWTYLIDRRTATMPADQFRF
jgi:hypothetical protein